MKGKPKVLVLAHDQFGYSSTKYKHCEFGRENFNITYIGWDYGLPKVKLPKVKIKYVNRQSNILVRNIRLLYAFHKEINRGYDVIFVNYVRGIALVKMLNYNANFILYIETLGIAPSKFKRWIFDAVLGFESLFFNHIALISSGISKRIRIKEYHVLPLGGHCFSTNSKSFQKLSLLYVGTLSNRKILECVKGFHKFINNHLEEASAAPSFTIVGDSPFGELEGIKQYVRDHNLENYVYTPGFIPTGKLNPFFDNANIGVAFVPITPYYFYQPPTKTFEYLLSGLPVIATATYANKEIVCQKVSELINDDADSFCDAVLRIQERKNEFKSEWIRRQYDKYTWQNVVKEKFVPLIEVVLKSKKLITSIIICLWLHVK